MSRIDEIDSFLRDVARYAKKSDFGVDETLIYGALKRYDFTLKEYLNGNNISQYFDYWIDYFKNKENIDVFIHPGQKSFLQFWSERNVDCEYIKLYVNVDSNSMLKSVNEIFSHLDSINAKHCSKVADRVRSDSIVLRIKDKRDVKDIIEFINNNSSIKEGAKKTNPFMIREGIVGMAYDDNLSYNSAVSFLISEYTNDKKQKQGLDNVNCIDFSNYVANYSRRLVTDKEFLNKFKNSYYFKNNMDRLEYYGEAEVLANMKRVFDLVDFNLNENNNLDDFLNMYDNSIKQKEQLTEDFTKMLVNTHELFINNCKATYEKYGRHQLEFAIDRAISGDYSAFTNDYNLRNAMKKYIGKDEIKRVVDGFIASSEMVFNKTEGRTCAKIIESMYEERYNSKTK